MLLKRSNSLVVGNVFVPCTCLQQELVFQFARALTCRDCPQVFITNLCSFMRIRKLKGKFGSIEIEAEALQMCVDLHAAGPSKV